MKKLKIKFKYCYGIRSFEHEFDFSQKSPYLIYAPNGSMKTSFAKSFQDFSNSKTPCDLVFTERETICEINDENGNSIQSEQIFVIEPYNEKYESDKLSTLLVNSGLRQEYENAHKNINLQKENLLKNIRQLSGLKKNDFIEEEIIKVFEKKTIFEVLEYLEPVISNEINDDHLATLTYSDIFNNKVLDLLETKEFKQQIEDYISKYDELIRSSSILSKAFNHYHADTVCKSLSSNGFFKAKHSVKLSSCDELLGTDQELKKIIEEEKTKVLKDKELQKKFDSIDKKLSNTELRLFRDCLLENQEIISELRDLKELSKKIWIAYLRKNKNLFDNLLNEYKKDKVRIQEIIEQSWKTKNSWYEAINSFNEKFTTIPFKLIVKNQDDVILKSSAPSIEFVFKESEFEKPLQKDQLLKVLSQGEKRALYILNIIFEVEARKKMNQETIFIIDDIADSFDYKNKYAIVEYLKEIADTNGFYQIILTHNFDFHRTASSRLNIDRNGCLNVSKTKKKVSLISERYQRNPFLYWKKMFAKDDVFLFASIPFVRNLAEYSGLKHEEKQLTDFLHIKKNTSQLTMRDLESIFKTTLKDKSALQIKSPERIFLDEIFRVANTICLKNDEKMNLENKVVLAIAIRLRAEVFMKNKINDETFCESIMKNQTFELIKKFKDKFSSETKNIKLLEQVNLMTPENIHLNSFMYEPILDMADDELKGLYKNLENLN